MTGAVPEISLETWLERLERVSADRCDLDVLLRDEFRHKFVARDDGSPRATARRALVIDGAAYAALEEQIRSAEDGDSVLAALALAALHTSLRAFAHGSKTVIALVDDGRTVPTVIDHAAHAALTCRAATQALVEAVRDHGAYHPADALFRRSLFDTALVRTDRELADAALPPTPITAIVHDDRGARCLRWTVVYASALFDAAVIDGLLDVVREVLAQYATGPTRMVRDIELISDAQKRQLGEWNRTDGAFPDDQRLEQLFEACAAREADREAVVFLDDTLTYRELNARANQLAHWLRGPAFTVAPRDRIGLYLDKSHLGVIATFAIWKAGAVYVPIDPTYPADRVRLTLANTQPTAVITNQRHAARLRELIDAEGSSARIIELEAALAADGATAAMSRANLALPLVNDELAYITYTSGTTGVPKGVPKDHRSAVNSITDLSQRYAMLRPGEERVALFASYVFEPHLRQTLIALINGQTLVVVPDDIRLDPDGLPSYLAHHRVTYLNATGSLLQHFDLRRCPALKKVLLVGEELTSAGLRQLRERFGGDIINEYAFTESAFVTAIKRFGAGETERSDRSIGRPLRNVTWYVLSEERKQVPITAIGELYIGGCGVAPGYLHQDELTRKAFFANPFRSEDDRARDHNARIYRTGDLARMLPNGEAEYLGRADHQLKINGVRIEPGEIEARATEFAGVQKCIVVAREVAGLPGERRLVGYFVADPEIAVAEAALIAFLEEHLIRVMVPARMIQLDRMPLNVNGKVDRRALPDPELHASAVLVDDHAHVEPALVSRLRAIWSSVLGVPVAQIDRDDDFFRLGGQSISCILLIARVRQQLRQSIGVEQVFALRTLGALADHLAASGEAAVPGGDAPAAGDAPSTLRANGLQQGLLFHALKTADGDDAYVVQSVYRYHTVLQPAAMEAAWRHARRTFPSLRLRFALGDEPLQIIEPAHGALDWRFVDLSSIDEPEQAAHLARLQDADRGERYRPLDGRLFRVYLIQHAAARFTLLFSCHHIVIDGWSLPVLHDEVHRAYLELVAGRSPELREDTAYLAAQRYWQAHRHDHVAYWTAQIERIEDRGDYSGLLDAASRHVALGAYDHVRDRRSKTLRLGAALTHALHAACTAHEVTLHSVLQFVWHQVLHAIGGGRSTVVGTIVSGRYLPIDGIDSSVGLFINTLPLVVDHDAPAARKVAVAIADIQAAVNTMNARSIVELGALRSGTLKRQLFDTLLVLENYPRLLADREAAHHRDALRFEQVFDADRVDHPLAVVGREEAGELTVTLWYAHEIFAPTAIETLLAVTHTLFAQVADDMARPVGELAYLSPAMIAQLAAGNATEATFPADHTLNAIFEQAAARWPAKLAVVYHDRRLSYQALDEHANQLAHHLRALAPLHPDDLIALVIDKSERMMIALLAVWKAGAAYVPIDPAYPDDRIAFMLTDTDARLVIANRAHAERLRAIAGDRLVIASEDLDATLAGEPRTAPAIATTSTDLAYAIYTSGTTGRPKAVLVEHRGVVNLQTSLARLLRLDRGDGDEALLTFSNYVFDHFVEVLTDALLNGQTLVVLDDRMRSDERRLCRYMNDHAVTYVSGTPSVLSLYDFSSVTSLRRIDAIGEDFTEPVFAKIRATFPHGLIINGYGPTEISITSHKRLYPAGELRRDKSIGLPVANTTGYVVNRAMQRVPVGGVGELYIGGVGVARGYLHRPELTAERFLANPFQTADDRRAGRNARLYKTGDLARWLANGEVEYLGRTDLQVKIRGQRVELGEIEAVLAAYPGVTRALVIARDSRVSAASPAPHKYLVGFYLGARELDEQEVKRWMRRTLSDALVPARIVRITDIPVTASGKLDSKRLPAPDLAPANAAAAAFLAPRSDLELRLCGVWSRVLGLGPERIGVDDDFFALGGDSLRAMTLAQAVTSTFDLDVGVATIFQDVTIAAQARRIAAGAAPAPLALAGRADGRPPVSFAQERLLFINEFEGGTSAYNISFTLRITGVTPGAVAGALRALVRRHAALRTLIATGDDGVHCQHVLDAGDGAARLTVESLAVSEPGELDRVLAARATHVFQLGDQLPVIAALITAGRDAPVLSLVFHHTCFDGWSWDLLRRELAALLAGTPEAALPALPASYADFAQWQRRHLAGRALDDLVQHWRQALAGIEPLRLPLDHPRPPRFDYRGREVAFALDAETTDRLRALARSLRVSLYSVLLAAWALMLRAYTGQHDLVIGTPSANRGRPEFSGVVGLFANLLAVRVRIDPAATVSAYVRDVGAAVVAAQIHAELPFEQLIQKLGFARDFSRHPVMQVNFTLLPWTGEAEREGALSMYAPTTSSETSVKFDLSAMLQEVADGLAGTVTYAALLLDPATVRGFLATFEHILAQLAHGAADRVGDIVWMPSSPAEAASRAAAAAGLPSSLHALFEREARARPDAVAVARGAARLTFRELDARANRLAHHLRARVALRSRELIALVVDKDERMIVAMLAVWKAGAGYLPIDPRDPDDRIAFMLGDVAARLVLTTGAHRARLAGLAASDVLDLDALDLGAGPSDAPDVAAHDDDLAYAIYTSGTTGRPKAVLVSQRNAVSFHAALRGQLASDGRSQERVLFLSSYVFDFSIEQLALSILSGNQLVLPPAPGVALHDCPACCELTYLSGTPTQIQQLDLARLPHVRGVLVAGEPFLRHHFEHIRRQYTGVIFNAYGTTETTVYNTVRRFAPGEAYRNDLGAPLANTRLYVLDDRGKPLPAGAAGELYIAGPCVSAGYLQRPALTAERFVPEPRGVMYKTGDVVRRTADGALQFLGRNDDQVKIRGLRIELGEIEAAIAACDGVRECAVAVREDRGDKRLVAYCVPAPGAALDDERVMATLRARLAPSMLPSMLVHMDRPLPLTITGKLDRAALPDPAWSAGQAAYAVPRQRDEARLCRLWAEQLAVDRVGIDDDFFRAGGDSISALRLASRVQRETGVAISVKHIFDHSTVRGLVDHVLSRADAAPAAPAEPEPLAGACPLLPIQRWFFAKPLVEPARWNQCFAIRTPALDPARLRAALAALVDHHDAFWLRFAATATGPAQGYASAPPAVVLYALDVHDLAPAQIRHQLAAWQTDFDLAHGPTACAAYLHGFADGNAQIWFAIHHLIVDVVSWRIITEDLEILYHGGSLGPRRATFRAWATAIAAYCATDDEQRLWAVTAQAVAIERAEGALAETGRPEPRHHRFVLSTADTQRLLIDRAYAYNSEVSDVLLTGLAYALQAVTERAIHHVTVEGHGRELIDGAPEVRDAVGWFTTMYPLTVEVGDSLNDSIARTQAHRRRVPHHGIGYGALRGTYGGERAPLPRVAFNYLGRFDGAPARASSAWRLDAATWAGALPHGEAVSDAAIDVTMSCVEGQLVTAIDSQLAEGITRRFTAALEAALRDLSAHTVAVSQRSAAAAAAFAPYIVINEDAPSGTLFMLPPGEGGAESYFSNLARQLPEHRLVLFNNLHLHTPGESFEALAAYYVDHVRRLQPTGPYHLLGWSFGGVLALEIARQLAQAGEPIANLFLIDSYFNIAHAVAAIGMPAAQDLLDPINYHYQPSAASLAALAALTGNLVLFKAGAANDVVTSEDQRRLFAHYHTTAAHHLDTLLPDHRIRIEALPGQTHHSWVRAPAVVETMGQRIATLLEAT